jgi:histidinol-phosphate aminotransferase
MTLSSPLCRPLSRRGFVQVLGAGTAAAALGPRLAAARTLVGDPAATPAALEVVRLSSNENPYGPSPTAFDAMREAFDLAWRYPDEAADALVADLAKRHGVPADHVLLGDGSSEILKLAAAACTGPDRPCVVADPTFEAIGQYARAAGAEVVKVPLTDDARHDLERMRPAGAGLVYLCNPNNPTGSITPKAEVRSFLARVPASTVVVADEAYADYADSDDYETLVPRAVERANLVVTRTFSKIYGMAGLRCGYAVARPETIARLRRQQAWDTLNVMALAAGRAGLADAEHTGRSRRLNRETRSYVASALGSLGCPVIPSQTNFVMAALGRDAGPVIEALAARGVQVGRRFPAMPEHLRVTVGTRPQMELFLEALRTVIA